MDEPPSLVYVPCAAHVATPGEAEPIALSIEDGRLVLRVYSSVDRLYAEWGAGHPWLGWPTEALGALRESQGIDRIALDADGSADGAGAGAGAG